MLAGNAIPAASLIVFEAISGETFEVVNTPTDATVGVSFEVVAREVEISRFAAHRPGRHLFVTSLVPTDGDP